MQEGLIAQYQVKEETQLILEKMIQSSVWDASPQSGGNGNWVDK
ncbi:MAG: hypothetical protein QNJ47_03935 [Nostocaceae cyanobacterium]|nr:hypothetical protein [Nostocaceae cyanobacterium]